MKISLYTAAFAAVVLCSHVAVAQQPAAKPAPKPTAPRVTSDYTEKQDADGSQVIDFGNDKLDGADGSQVIDFGNDKLDGAGVDYWGGMVKAPPTMIRSGLIRPRMNFVPELLKSVENL
jgi:hypothetical protein